MAKTKKKPSPAEDRESHLDRIFDRAQKLVRGLKMPGFSDWVKFTVIGVMEFPSHGRGMMVPDDASALPREAMPEPEFKMQAPQRIAFRSSGVGEIQQHQKGTVIQRHSMGGGQIILVSERWETVCEMLGVDPPSVVDPEPNLDPFFKS